MAGFTVAGAGTGAVAPPGLAVILNLKVTRGTGRGQGRKYIGPVDAGVIQANGTVGESWRQLVEDAAEEHILQTGVGDGAFVAYTPERDVARDFVAASVPNKFGMLRSRRD